MVVYCVIFNWYGIIKQIVRKNSEVFNKKKDADISKTISNTKQLSKFFIAYNLCYSMLWKNYLKLLYL